MASCHSELCTVVCMHLSLLSLYTPSSVSHCYPMHAVLDLSYPNVLQLQEGCVLFQDPIIVMSADQGNCRSRQKKREAVHLGDFFAVGKPVAPLRGPGIGPSHNTRL